MILNVYTLVYILVQLEDHYAYMHEQITKELEDALGTESSSTAVHPFNVQATVYSKRNAHLIPIFFLAPLGEGDQNFTWSTM